MPRPPSSPSILAASAALAEQTDRKRESVRMLCARGYSPAEIASILKISKATVLDYIQALDVERAVAAVPSLETRLNRAIADTQAIMQAAWKIIDEPNLDAKSQSRVAAMVVVKDCLDRLDRLQGTSAPEAVNAKVVAEMFNVVMDVLAELGGPSMQALFMAKLQARHAGTTTGVVMSGGAVAQLAEPAEAAVGDDEQ